MSPPTRRSVLAALGAAVSVAGCVTDAGPDTPADSTTERPTPDPTTTSAATGPTSTTATDSTPADPGTTDDWISRLSSQPDPDHAVTLYNEGSEPRTVRVRVVREETGETVFEATRESPPGTEAELYDLVRADPDGIEAFAVCGELVDATTDDGESDARDCVTLRTNACYGNAHVTVLDDGSLRVIYSIC